MCFKTKEETIIYMGSMGTKYIYQQEKSFDYNILKNDLFTHEVKLIDISTNEDWIAYIAKHEGLNKKTKEKWFLTISQFKGADTKVDRYSFDITNAYNHDDEKTCIFLSISPDGRRVAISFANVDDDGHINNNPSENEACLVYKLKKSKISLFNAGSDEYVLKLDKSIRFQGRAVFSKKNDLFLINRKVLKIYNESYHMTSWFELEKFQAELMSFFAIDYTSDPHWAWYKNGLHTSESKDLKFIITISRHIHNNILISPYKTEAHIWSIAENGARLTSILKKEDEEIMAFSSNNKFLATYVHKTGEVNVYNIKSGTFLHSLKRKHQIPDLKTFEVTSIRFCLGERYLDERYLDEHYLTMAGLGKGANGDGAEVEVVFEAWHIESEQSIYSKSIKTKIPPARNMIFAPFLLVHPPNKTAKHQTSTDPNCATSEVLSESSTVATSEPSVKSQGSHGETIQDTQEKVPDHDTHVPYVDDNNVHDKRTVNALTIEVYEVPKTTNERIPIQNAPDTFWVKATSDLSDTDDTDTTTSEAKKKICYVRSYQKRMYLLQFGKRLVQLWRLPEGSTTQEKDGVPNITHIKPDGLGELLFIHAYKASHYNITSTFRESWSLKGNENENEIEQNVIIKQDNTNGIDRIVVGIVMDQEKKAPEKETPEKKAPKNKVQEKKVQEKKAALIEFSAELFIPFKEIVTSNSTFSKNSLHLYLKSASQALHYLYELKNAMQNAERSTSDMQKITDLFKKTKVIVLSCVKHIANTKPKEYTYFSTITGSNILAMLASFKEGQHIIYLLLKIEQLPISLFSYAKKLTDSQEKEYYLSTNENALTVLIDNKSFDLYKLLFNRILSNSKVVGIGSLSAITDVLIFLQETSNNELLISSCKKLSYLTVDTKKTHILDKETEHISNLTKLHKTYISSFKMQESYAVIEQITQYDNTLISRIEYKWDQSRTYLTNFWRFLTKSTKLDTVISSLKMLTKGMIERRRPFEKLCAHCVVPLPHFLTYSDFPDDRKNIQGKSRDDEKNSGSSPYKSKSSFIRIATNQNKNNVFTLGDSVFEVLLAYKWAKFVRIHFIIMYLFCITYYIGYTVGISFAREVFSYQPGTPLTDGGQITCVAISLFSMSVLIIQEIRQAYGSNDIILYLSSFYNWVDWAAYSLSLASLSLLTTGGSNFEEINTFATLLLWTHAILKLRIFPYVGIAIETIIQLIREVGGILLIMVLVIGAFTNGLITLLSYKEDAYFQEQYQGNLTYPGFNGSDAPNLALVDSSTGNDFGDVFNTFTNVWFFMFGVWDPITGGDAGDNKLTKVIAILFSFIVALIFSNILIAYMNSAIEDVKSRGKKACIRHFASVIAETEQIWCRESTRCKRQNNPMYIYYTVSNDIAREQEEDLNRETQKLFKKLKEAFAEERKSSYNSTLNHLKERLETYGNSISRNKQTFSEICEDWRKTNDHLKEKLEALRQF